MNRSALRLTFLGLTVAVAAGCADQAQQLTEPRNALPALTADFTVYPYVIPPCPSTQDSAQKSIDNLLPQLFAPGNARRGKAQGYSNNMEKARKNSDATTADTYADSLINFTLQQYYASQLLNQGSDLAGTQQRLVSFITYIYCFNGYSPMPDKALFDLLLSANNSVLIRNGTPTTVVNDQADSAGVRIPQGAVPNTIFGTFVSIIKTPNAIPTSLDWYGLHGYKSGAFEFMANPAVTFTSPVLTGVCISYDADIVTSPNDLRLAHPAPANLADVAPGNYVLTTAGGSIEIGAPATSDLPLLGLACTPLNIASTSFFGRALEQFASVLLPDYLAAIQSGGGVGSTVKSFSPFAVVDIRLAVASTGPTSPVYIPLNSTTTTAPVSVTTTTRNGHTAIDSVPVTFATSTTGSSFSPASPATNATGTASSTWTLVSGTNTGTGTPAKSPLVFTPSAANFSVNVVQETTLNFVGPATVPNGQQGSLYPSQTFTASGGSGAGSYSWAVTAGALPAGLTLNTATGVLIGTPTAAGSFSFTVTVTSGAQSAFRAYSMTVALPPVTITTTSPLPSATKGASYTQTLIASGGAGAGSYAWALANATSLPAGLSLSAAGVISGTPSALGTSSFDVTVTSGTGATAVSSTKTFSLSVINPTSINLTFSVAPSKNVCYAVNTPMTPGIVARVTDQGGSLLTGVTVNIVGVTNNGAKVAVSPPSAVSSGGLASFGGPTINKAGGYALLISTAAPWPTATNTSAKFTISPSC